jgi:hypothetical protein
MCIFIENDARNQERKRCMVYFIKASLLCKNRFRFERLKEVRIAVYCNIITVITKELCCKAAGRHMQGETIFLLLLCYVFICGHHAYGECRSIEPQDVSKVAFPCSALG